MSDNIIKVESVSKKYCRSIKHTMLYGVSDLAKSFLGFEQQTERLRDGEFWAVNDISFEAKSGETVGIIGQNGSGKSTLLKMLNGIIMPDKGRIEIAGKVGALIEVGAGFHPMLTGRENVYVNGAIFGMSKKEIDDKFDEIIDFAGIGGFIDSPVKHYSSGMYVRLGFAIAAHAEPDIFLIDEALAVGDAKFQAKCFRKLEEFRGKNKTILFVTHSMEEIVRHCDRAILVNDGLKISEGDPKDISNLYMDLLFGDRSGSKGVKVKDGDEAFLSNITDAGDLTSFMEDHSGKEVFHLRKSYNKNEYRWGNRHAEIIDYFVVSGGQKDPIRCDASEEFNLYLKVRFNETVERPIYGLIIKTVDGISLFGNNSRDYDSNCSYVSQEAGDLVIVQFSITPRLVTGDYILSIGVAEEQEGGEPVALDRRYDSIHLHFTQTGLFHGLFDMGLELKHFATRISGIK